MRYILCLALLFMVSGEALGCDDKFIEKFMMKQKDLEQQMRELTAPKGARLRIEPTPQSKTGKKIGKWDEAKRLIVCGQLPEIMGVMKTQGAWPVFGGQTMQGEHVQLFRNPDSGLWFFIAAGPVEGEGCSLGGGWKSISALGL